MARILILGGGFAGVTSAEIITARGSVGHEITLVSASDRFTFYPALVPMVFGDLTAGEISSNLGSPLRQRGVRFVRGEVLNIDPRSKAVRISGTDIDGELYYDLLIIAMGRSLATEKVPGFFEYAHHLLGAKPAQNFKNAIDEFKQGSIVLGLCPDGELPIPVCESALALAAKFEKQMTEQTVSITAVFPQSLDRALVGAGLFRDIGGAFIRKGIKLVTDFPIDSVDEKYIIADGQSPISYDLLMLVPPFRGQAPIQRLYEDEESDGFARVNSKMQLEGFDGIYAAGDMISLDGPRFGYMAMRQARVAAVNALVELSGETPSLGYVHKVEWVLGEKCTHPNFFHYGVWDNTLSDFDENALLGMAKQIRERYGLVTDTGPAANIATINQ